jgi:hypothetical protein
MVEKQNNNKKVITNIAIFVVFIFSILLLTGSLVAKRIPFNETVPLTR